MTESRREDVVQQAFFGVSLDNNKHTMITTSLPDSAIARWRNRLSEHTRLQPDRDGNMPRTALSYLTFENEGDDEWVAVVRRVSTGHSEGRTNAHALIGSASALNVPLSLALNSWTGWLTNPPSGVGMGSMNARYLAEALAEPPWTAQLAPIEDQFIAVLAQLLDEPAKPLSIIGCAEQDRPAMVWGLREAVDAHAARDPHFARHGRRRWSYSTYQDRHDAGISNLPEIVFLTGLPGMGASHRAVVDLRREPQDSRSRDLACVLADSVLRDAPLPPSAGSVETVAKIRLSSGVPQRQHAAVRTGQRPVETTRVQPAEHSGQSRGGHVDVGSQWAKKLAEVDSLDQLQRELADLCRLEPAERAQLRGALAAGTLDRIADLVEVRVADDLIWQALCAVYGPDLQDLQDGNAQKHLVDLGRRGRSERLGKMLAAVADKRGDADLMRAIVRRMVDGGRRPSGPARLKRASQPPPQVRGNWLLIIAAVVILLSLLGVAFAIGLAVGQPSSQVQPTVVPTTSPQQQVAPTEQQPTVPPRPAAGTVHLEDPPLASHVMYAFIQVGERFYPQARCTSEGVRVDWKCPETGDPVTTGGDRVGIPVPLAMLDELDTTAKAANYTAADRRWGSPVRITVG